MLSDLLHSLVLALPNKIAWIEADGQGLAWKQLAEQVSTWHKRLSEMGVGPGDVVVTQLPNGLAAVAASIAIQSLEACESPVDRRFGASFAEMACQSLGARILITEAGPLLLAGNHALGEKQNERRPAVHGSALILWTSGTTAEPKAVVHDWRSIIANAQGKLSAAPQTPDDRRLTVLPLSHAYARTCDMVTWLLSGSVLAAADGWRGLEQLAPVVRPTLMNAVPYLIDKIFQSVTDDELALSERLQELGLDQLRMLGCGGAALSPERFQQIQRLGIAPIQGYGLTETGPVICSASPADARPGVVGRVIENTEIRISEVGEIQCRGPGVMLGYWNDPRATSQRVTADGWFRTGDGGELESDGMLRVNGRLDEVIVLSNGYKFWPLELERRLSAVEGVRHAIVRGCGVDLEVIVDAERGIDDGQMLEKFQVVQRDLEAESESRPPRIARLTRVERPLSVETGELTAKQTVRREVVLRKYFEG